MNLQQLTALTRMRWQIGCNLFQKSGKANQVLLTIALILAGIASLGSFVFAVGWGRLLLGRLETYQLLYVWDVVAGLFLFVWSMSIITELQRTELLSLKNLLHLPVSLAGGFILNYLSSLVSLTILLLLPLMLGLCFASVRHYGVESGLSFLLLASFMLMVTAFTYLVRGWLGKLMENPRTRGTVITVTTIFFVMVFQIPNMFNTFGMRQGHQESRERREAHHDELEELLQQKKSGTLERADYKAAVDAAKAAFQEREVAIKRASSRSFYRKVEIVNLSVPPLWLCYGASAAARGAILGPLLCVFGMTAIGIGSLVVSFRSTVRTYHGNDNRKPQTSSQHLATTTKRSTLLEARLPFLTDTQSAIALATWKKTLRAPESKMALLTPLIFAAMFGSAIFSGSMDNTPHAARPWLTLAAISVSLFGLAQLLINMFGMDRQGFRAYLLMPVDRSDILLGKNLGVFPIVGGLTALLVVAIGIIARVPAPYSLATLLQIPVTYLCYYVVTNQVSIIAPVGLMSGTMKPVSLKVSTVIAQILAMFFSPLMLLPAALALGADFALNFFVDLPKAMTDVVPVYLVLTLLELPIVIWCYRYFLKKQGRLLQDREQQILETIARVAE